MPAIDTVGAFITNTAALGNATASPGDSFATRAFQDPNYAKLEQVILKGTAARTVRITSPVFHDAVRGLTFISAQAPTQVSMPQDVGQPLRPNDTLGVQLTSGAADSTVAALGVYYSQLPGINARLYNYSDLAGLIKNIKPLEVDCAASANIGTWADTSITATENLLHANTDYAVLGYNVDVACAVVAIRGGDTGNLRIGGPGTVLQDTAVDFFVDMSDRHGVPHIPVINAANAGNTVVSVLDNVAGTAVKVQLILAELSQNVN